MENKISRKPFLPIVIIFFVISLLAFGFKSQLQARNVDVNVLLTGNLVLFIAAVFSLSLFSKGLQDKSNHVFLRNTYGGMFLRMGICILSVVIYALASGGKVNKLAIFACLGFYLLYTFAEVKILMTLSKQQKNA